MKNQKTGKGKGRQPGNTKKEKGNSVNTHRMDLHLIWAGPGTNELPHHLPP